MSPSNIYDEGTEHGVSPLNDMDLQPQAPPMFNTDRRSCSSVAATKLSSKFHAKVSRNFRHESLNIFHETFL